MKFFKYLVFIIITICSTSAFADGYYWVHQSYLTSNQGFLSFPNPNAFSSIASACNWLNGKSVISRGTAQLTNTEVLSNGDGKCTYTLSQQPSSVNTALVIRRGCSPDIPACAPQECPEVGYPMYVYFDAGGKIPQQRCQPLADKFCVFKAKPDSIVLNHANNRQSTVLYNVSKTPVSSCTPLDAGQCDKNDPYGDCYQPPNDGCTRLADGSITCPDGAAPPSPTGTCGGATYCNRPPTGCGTGYVSGSFNGQALCVKSSNSGTGSGTGDGGGSGTGSGDGGSGTGDGGGSGSGTPIDTGTGSTNINNSGSGSGSSTGGSGGGTTSTSFTIDLSPVVRAISALSDKLTWVKSELVNAVSRVEDKLTQTNSKLDTTNSKLDSVKSSVDQTTAAVNANATTVKTAVEANTAATNNVKSAVDANTNSTANKLNEVVNAINNKPIGGGGGTTDVKPVVDAIEKQTTDFKDMMKTDSSDFDTSQYEKIGDASDDPRSLNAQSDAAGSLQALSNKLTFSNSACVQDFTVTVPIYGSMTVPLSQWCDLLALVKILLHLCTLMVAFKMLDSTVRAI